jgi:hypothetical protein
MTENRVLDILPLEGERIQEGQEILSYDAAPASSD